MALASRALPPSLDVLAEVEEHIQRRARIVDVASAAAEFRNERLEFPLSPEALVRDWEAVVSARPDAAAKATLLGCANVLRSALALIQEPEAAYVPSRPDFSKAPRVPLSSMRDETVI